MEPTGTTLTEDRFVPARTLPLFLALFAFGFIVLLFTLKTVNGRTVEELQKNPWSRRAHVGIDYWNHQGYFRTAGLPVRETLVGKRELYYYRSSSGAFMLSGLFVQKVYGAFTGGKYAWQPIAVHHQLVSLVTSALLSLLAFRIAARLGIRPLHALIVAVVTQAVFFTFPGNLELYWEITEMQWCLLFALLFLLLEEKTPTRRITLLRGLLVFLLTYFSVATGVFFILAYVAARLVLYGRFEGFKRFVATLLVPAAVAVTIYACQRAWVSYRYPDVPKYGSTILFRSGFDGSRSEYNDHMDLLIGRQRGGQLKTDAETELRRPWLFGGGFLAVLALFVAYARSRIGTFPVLVIASVAGTYLLSAGVFSQGVVIHPYLFDPIIALPLMLAMYAGVPALLETLTGRTGAFVLIALFAGYVHANANMREYAIRYPLPGARGLASPAGAAQTAGAAAAPADPTHGVWKNVAYAPASFTANTGEWTVERADQTTYAYTYLGAKTMMVAFFIQATDVTATPRTLQIAIPEGKIAARAIGAMCRVRDAGGDLTGGFVMVPQNGKTIAVQKLDGKPWKATEKDDTLVFGSITFEIR